MKPQTLALIEQYSKLKSTARRVEESRRAISEALTHSAQMGISFSAGKDSTVLLDLVREQDSSLPVVFFDEGWDFPETLEFLRATETRIGKRILRVAIPVGARFWQTEVEYRCDDPASDHHCDMTMDEWERGFGGSFIGLRKDESRGRRINLKINGMVYFNKELQHWCCCPLANWTALDVWSYIFSRRLAYNAVYDKLDELGIPLERARVGPLTAWQVYQFGSLAIIRRGWLDLFNRFASFFPEARNFV